MKLLVVTDIPFWQRHRGCDRRIQALTRWLAQHAQLKLCFVGELAASQWHVARKSLGFPVGGPGQPGYWHALLSRLSGQPAAMQRQTVGPDGTSDPSAMDDRCTATATLDQFRDSAIARFVKKEAAAFQPDIVLIEYLSFVWLADDIRQASPSTKIVVDTHDVMHLRQAEFERQGLCPWLNIDAEQEAKEFRAVDAVIAISEQDRASFDQLLNNRGPAVLLAHHPASEDTKSLRHRGKSSKTQSTSATESVKIGFIGSSGAANQSSLNAFLSEVWPQLTGANQPSIQLLIAGPLSSSDISITADGALEWWGPVDDVADFYSQIDIAINPATINSGFKIKSLEALSWGCPLVTTEAGIAGLEPARDSAALVAGDWKAFADAVRTLAIDPVLRRQMAENALRIVAQHYRADATFAELFDWMTQAMGSPQ